jgi:hypothetical protein
MLDRLAALALCMTLVSACVPAAAPITLEAAATPTTAAQRVTPVAWQVVPTPTPGRLAPTARPSGPLPTFVLANTTPRPTPAPTSPPPAPPPPPPPTPEPALHCQFANGGAVTLQPTVVTQPRPAPGVVPTVFQPAPGLLTVAASEPLPGASLELRLPRTLLAGAVIQPQITVHNASPTDVAVDAGVMAWVDGQSEPFSLAQRDPRMWPPLHRGPPGGLTVPSGQTWALTSLVQLPFDASQPVHLQGFARLGVYSPPTPEDAHPTTLTANVPVKLVAPTPDQQLTLELHVDRQQWCLRATTASGHAPAEPLVMVLIAQSPQRWYSEGGPNVGAAGTWAGRLGLDGASVVNGVVHRMSDDPFDVTAWVGGPSYVTATTPPAHVAAP